MQPGAGQQLGRCERASRDQCLATLLRVRITVADCCCGRRLATAADGSAVSPAAFAAAMRENKEVMAQLQQNMPDVSRVIVLYQDVAGP